MIESEKDAQARWILKKDLPMCVCKPTNPRHKEGWRCLTREQLQAWAAAEKTGLVVERSRLNDQKRLAFMWLHFSQDPEARRLSGRVVTLEEADRLKSIMDLDAWDDAAGMTNLQRMMFP